MPRRVTIRNDREGHCIAQAMSPIFQPFFVRQDSSI